jgi:hypothetical protein
MPFSSRVAWYDVIMIIIYKLNWRKVNCLNTRSKEVDRIMTCVYKASMHTCDLVVYDHCGFLSLLRKLSLTKVFLIDINKIILHECMFSYVNKLVLNLVYTCIGSHAPTNIKWMLDTWGLNFIQYYVRINLLCNTFLHLIKVSGISSKCHCNPMIGEIFGHNRLRS